MTNDRNHKETLAMIENYLGYCPVALDAPLPPFTTTPSYIALYNLIREALEEHKADFFISMPRLEDGTLWVELYQCRGVPPLPPQKIETLRAHVQSKLPPQLKLAFRCRDIFSAEEIEKIRNHYEISQEGDSV